MSYPEIEIGTPFKVVEGRITEDHEVDRIVGQFVFLGHHRFHRRDDRIGQSEWRNNSRVTFRHQPEQQPQTTSRKRVQP